MSCWLAMFGGLKSSDCSHHWHQDSIRALFRIPVGVARASGYVLVVAGDNSR